MNVSDTHVLRAKHHNYWCCYSSTQKRNELLLIIILVVVCLSEQYKNNTKKLKIQQQHTNTQLHTAVAIDHAPTRPAQVYRLHSKQGRSEFGVCVSCSGRLGSLYIWSVWPV